MAGRLRIDHVECTEQAGVAEARVELSLHEVAHTCLSRAAGPEAWLRALSEATIRAVATFVSGRLDVSLDSASLVSAGRFPLVVVTMNMIDGGGRLVFLSGTAAITDDRYLSVVKAVLHGLNRWLEPVLETDLAADGVAVQALHRPIH